MKANQPMSNIYIPTILTFIFIYRRISADIFENLPEMKRKVKNIISQQKKTTFKTYPQQDNKI